jgi:hypothetical protein
MLGSAVLTVGVVSGESSGSVVGVGGDGICTGSESWAVEATSADDSVSESTAYDMMCEMWSMSYESC